MKVFNTNASAPSVGPTLDSQTRTKWIEELKAETHEHGMESINPHDLAIPSQLAMKGSRTEVEIMAVAIYPGTKIKAWELEQYCV